MRYLRTFIQILKEIDTRPTKYFIYLVLAIVGLFFLAYMHNYNIVYIMMFFTFALAGASSILGRLNLYEIQAEVLGSQNLFSLQSSPYSLNIINSNEERDSFALECSNETSTVVIDELPGGKTKSIQLDFTPSQRGLGKLPPLRIGSHFPLPHEMLFKKLSFTHDIIVYPEPKGESLDSFMSKYFASVGEYDDFEGIRSFRQGESLSLIYWPSLAKGQELMSKEFSLLERTKHLHFDFTKAADNDESRLSQLCLWALECEKKMISYSMHFPSKTLNSESRSHNEILEFLALY